MTYGSQLLIQRLLMPSIAKDVFVTGTIIRTSPDLDVRVQHQIGQHRPDSQSIPDTTTFFSQSGFVKVVAQ